MLFNSLPFLVFFPLVTLLYWILPHQLRNTMLLIASYYFYMCWEPIYALLILLSSVTTWGCAILIERQPTRRKIWLISCILLNIGILFLFKYMGFFNSQVTGLLRYLGIYLPIPSFTLLLPVGISFYTFQALGYIIDVYREDLKPERNLPTYCLFVSFFPQLVAGPIERAGNLLSQFHHTHQFNSSELIEGLRLMAWGYFMKLCIAEAVAPYVDAVYNNLQMHSGQTIWLASFFFTFQIFCDFGGYSLIAIGTAKCMGFHLMQNFRQPYLTRNIREFWHRWHISLSSWFSDYVYKPLGGSRCSVAKHQRNLFTTFVVSGLWHGANWTFIFWGAYHGALQCAAAFLRRNKLISRFQWIEKHKIPRRLCTILSISFCFLLVMIGWVLFRANSMSDAILALQKMTHLDGPLYNGDGKPEILLPLLLIGLLMIRETRDELKLELSLTGNKRLWVSAISVSLLFIVIMLCAHFESGQFIYFQF